MRVLPVVPGAVPIAELGSDIQPQQVSYPPAHLMLNRPPSCSFLIVMFGTAEHPETWMVVWVSPEV